MVLAFAPRSSVALPLVLLSTLPALAESSNSAPLQVTVTPLRSEQPIAVLGSAVTVVSREEIERSNPAHISDVLRMVPGLDISTTGTPASASSVRLRGAESRHTLVLIDGVRVNDPSTSVGEFDFSNLVPGDVERIEILRGPQSALYGSDAIGGVINIITRPGSGPPRVTYSVEGGARGTIAGRLGISGSSGDVSYSFSAVGFHTNGFSAFGHRIRRLEALFGPFERDGSDKVGLHGRIRWQATPWLALEAGITSTFVNGDYDAAFGSLPDSPSRAHTRFNQIWGRAIADTLEGRLRHSVKVYANHYHRDYRNIFAFFGPTTWDNSSFTGERFGAEYQGDLRLGPWGLFSFGAGIETERAKTDSQAILPVPGPLIATNYGSRTTMHAFAIHQLPIGERWKLSLGGRIDHIDRVDTFATYRATAAYLMPEIGSKLRASIGTGAKAPSLFQLFDPSYGNPNLRAEHSFGADMGFDTRLLDGRLRFSGTVFYNAFRDLIDFTFVGGPIGFGTYINVARAQTYGAETSLDADLSPGYAMLRAVYTYTEAKDLDTGLMLLRRPRHKGALALILTPHPRLTIEPRLTFVGRRFDYDSLSFSRVEMPSYARIDLRMDYRLDERLSLFLRGENLTNRRYEDVRNYGTSGAAVTVGLQGRL